MERNFNRFKNHLETNPWSLILLFSALGLGLTSWWIRSSEYKASTPEKQFRKLLAEEEKQTRPFPKDIDLEPPFE